MKGILDGVECVAVDERLRPSLPGWISGRHLIRVLYPKGDGWGEMIVPRDRVQFKPIQLSLL